MKFPIIFVNHGGGPLPLLGKQPAIGQQFRDVRSKVIDPLLPKSPKAIIIVSAHYESDPIEIMSSVAPPMYYDYYGFPPETYQIQYPAPGSPSLAQAIHDALATKGIPSKLNPTRGYDHGMFVPLKLMFPEATIPVVGVSIHNSLDAATNIELGKALGSVLSDNSDDVLLIGSGFTFHNMKAFFNPSDRSYKEATNFNNWLKETILLPTKHDTGEPTTATTPSTTASRHHYETMLGKLVQWKSAPGGLFSHPREEHLVPLFVAAAAAAASGTDRTPQLIYDSVEGRSEHPVSSYMFV